MDSLGIGKYDGLRVYQPPKPQGEAYRPTRLGAYHRCRVSTGDPLLADYEHRASDPHRRSCSVVRRVEIPFQVAIGLNPKTTAANSVDERNRDVTPATHDRNTTRLVTQMFDVDANSEWGGQ